MKSIETTYNINYVLKNNTKNQIIEISSLSAAKQEFDNLIKNISNYEYVSLIEIVIDHTNMKVITKELYTIKN